MCDTCPVIDTCRRHALDVQEQYGVWGGLSEEERLLLLNRGRRSLRRKVLAQNSKASNTDDPGSEPTAGRGSANP